MRNAVLNIIENIIGAILIGLGLIYLMFQYKSLKKMTDIVTDKTVQEKNINQQNYDFKSEEVTHTEIISTIMGLREYPIMVDNNLIPVNDQDYNLFFSYIKIGIYEKKYIYDESKNIQMIQYKYLR